MGDSATLGDMEVGQASAEDLLSTDSGAPVLTAVGAEFMSLHATLTSMGNSEASNVDEQAESPAQFISVRYLSPLGLRTTQLPWKQGMTVQHALHAMRRCDPVFRSVANPLGSARVVGNQRVRMHHVLKQGDVLRLNPTTKPFF